MGVPVNFYLKGKFWDQQKSIPNHGILFGPKTCLKKETLASPTTVDHRNLDFQWFSEVLASCKLVFG
jgi:hypothetical protein